MFASLKGDEGEAQTYVEGVREALEETSLEHYVTGAAAVNHDFQETSEKDLKRAEVLTAGLVLLLLLFTFRTVVAALVPLLLGAAAVVSATAVLYLIGSLAGHVDLRPQHRVDDRPRPRDRLLVDRRQPLPRGVSEAQGPAGWRRRSRWRPPAARSSTRASP